MHACLILMLLWKLSEKRFPTGFAHSSFQGHPMKKKIYWYKLTPLPSHKLQCLGFSLEACMSNTDNNQ